ncbi:AGC family protein kinase [Trichomonas vaginalis G3]|uniref:RING-type E3 ubiquitin transferase n=1 Tax=Trichomonas vaginalis (strain ATCC PRA-98 / G3) TaxID=412133 RepID=A2DQU9_TRIV3|nr:3-phosphoinositide-dependent protein kinase protein [Trichomonas vaginalis G3]EAY17216.1 AGC family protein kinase [Trichomonas vaginalis G3]KAI5486252.1 3-phosphoinositide-dependent protein kinase protein [Trichomonas vaginalis G3]|eukprot:XP_001329439.1 AGC family protein kinase [Trichomonas vaginalis G3]
MMKIHKKSKSPPSLKPKLSQLWNTRNDFNIISQRQSSNKKYQVCEVELKRDNSKYTLQIISTTELLEHKNVEEITKETSILMSIHHPNILQQIASFQEDENLYNLFENISSENLATIVGKYKSLSILNARLIFAQLLKATAFLHQKAFIHCNIKPSSILFDKENRVKLSQFIFSQSKDYPNIRSSKTCFFQQNMEYLAPEIIDKKSANHSTDLWALGCILYFMLSGESPFHVSGNQQEIKRHITLVNYTIPHYFPPDAADLISKLLKKKPEERLGHKDYWTDYKTIQTHPFFKGFNWNQCEFATQISFTPFIQLNNNMFDNGQLTLANKIVDRKSLEFKFKTDLKSAIKQCESIFCHGKFSNIQEFNQYIASHYHPDACQYSWSVPTLVVQCKTCRMNKLSAICLNCYLNSDHRGHNVNLCVSVKGNCDCGDNSNWKKEGCCSRHNHHDQKSTNFFTNQEMENFEVCFSAALSNAHLLSIYVPPTFNSLVKWLIGYAKLCEGTRSALANAFIKTIDIEQLFMDAALVFFKSAEGYYLLFHYLVNDDNFRNKMTEVGIKVYSNLILQCLKLASVPRSDPAVPPFFQIRHFAYFLETAFTNQNFKNIIDKGIDCSKTFIDSFSLIIDYSLQFNVSIFKKARYEEIFKNYASLISAMNGYEKCRNSINEIIKTLSLQAIKLEGALPTSRQFGEKANDLSDLHQALSDITYCISILCSKITKGQDYNYDVVFDTLGRWINQNLFENDFDNIEDENMALFRSIMQPSVNISVGLAIHNFAGMILRSNLPNAKNLLSLACETDQIDLSYFCINAALLPVRLFAAEKHIIKYFVRNSTSFIKAITSIKNEINVKLFYAPLFAFVQILLSLSQDKDMFIGMIARNFGIFDEFTDEDDDVSIQFAFLHFITCLIFDRTCITDDRKRMKLQTILFSLATGPIQLVQISQTLWCNVLSDNDFMTELFKHVNRSTADGRTRIRLQNERDWHPFAPWFQTKNILEAMAYYTSHYPESIIPFPEYEDNPHLYLQESLSSNILLAIEFNVISNAAWTNSYNACLHIVVNLLVQFSKFSKERGISPKDSKMIIAKDLEELVTAIPDKFEQFMLTPISFKGRAATTALDIITSFGKWTYKSLEEMSIGFVPPHDSKTTTNKKMALMAKKRALDELQCHLSNFDFYAHDETEHKETCSVCASELGLLHYPVLAYNSPMADVIENSLNGTTKDSYNTTTMFKMCTHPVHPVCLNWKEGFQCPVCRGRRNALIPIINDFSGPLSDQQIESINNCIQFIFGKANAEYILQSFCAHLTVSEIRFRLKPDFIDQPNFHLLTKYLFISLYHYFKINDKLLKETPFATNDPLIILVMQLLVNEDPKTGYVKRVSSIGRRVSPDQRLEFARRSALIEHFCLNERFEDRCGFTDWDDILSASSLSVRYQLEIPDFSLPAYVLLKLPLDYVDLARQPYSLEIRDMYHDTGLCLLTGKVVKFSQKTEGGFPTYKEHVRKVLGNTFSPIMYITGRNSTSVVIYSGVVKKIFDVTTAYVDNYGESDVGFKRGAFLKLSSEKMLHLVELILSGDWMDANADNFTPAVTN